MKLALKETPEDRFSHDKAHIMYRFSIWRVGFSMVGEIVTASQNTVDHGSSVGGGWTRPEAQIPPAAHCCVLEQDTY